MILAKKLILGYDKAITPEINLELNYNQWIGVVGQNGSGKSTFLKTILGQRPAYSGELEVLGEKPGTLNHEIAYIPQEREINLTDNMSAYSFIKASIKPWLFGFNWHSRKTLVNLDNLVQLVGAEEYIHDPFIRLSGGQKKRVYLIQALVDKPRLLLLDEPLADLDPLAKEQFLCSLKQIHNHEKISLIMISHDMKEVHTHLDAFIHFGKTGVHYCERLSCISEDSYI